MIGSNNFRSESSHGASCVQPSVFRVRNVNFRNFYISPACLDYFSLDEFTPLCLKIYAFPDTGTPQVPNTLGIKTTQVFGPSATSHLRKLSSSISAWWRVDYEKRHEKDLSESKTRDCSMIECISLSKKSTRASRGWDVFLLEAWGSMGKKKTDAATSSNTARIPRKVTHQPHQLLSYCNCHAICQCQPISYTLPAATLFWVTLLWATPPSLFVLFISKSWFSNLQNPRAQEFLN